jgi:RimJ/RimL family protein N-acetyltransferase
MIPAKGVATLHTDRLDLVPLTREVCEAIVAGDRAHAGTLLGAELGEWPREEELDSAFPAYVTALRADPTVVAWQGRAIVLRGSGIVIGSANLKGPPTADGRIEVGYGLIDAYQGHGYAREAVEALLTYVFADASVRYATAVIEPENARSVHLAEALGFIATHIASMQHEGHEIWLLPRGDYER